MDELPDVDTFARELKRFADRADRAFGERNVCAVERRPLAHYERMARLVLRELGEGRALDLYQEFVGHALRAAKRKAGRMAAKKTATETKNKGGRPPLPMLTPRAAVTTSVRLYPRDQARFDWCRYELGRVTGSEVWRAALLALERELKAKRKAAKS